MFGYREEIAWLASHCRDTRKNTSPMGVHYGGIWYHSLSASGLYRPPNARRATFLSVDAERFYRNSTGHGASLKGFSAENCLEEDAGILWAQQAELNSHLPLSAILRFVYTFALGINYRPGRQAVNCWDLSQHKVINLAGGLPAEPMISSHYGPSEVVLLSAFMRRKQTLLCYLARLLDAYQIRQV